MLARLAVMALAVPPIAVVAADMAVVPLECVRLAEQVGLPPKLTSEQMKLALAMIDQAMKLANDDQRALLKKCEKAIKDKSR